jgi:lipoprotein-anchoring transpeptidase ErfK/SrfK
MVDKLRIGLYESLGAPISRRQFMNLGGLALAGAILPRFGPPGRRQDLQIRENLGRVTVGRMDLKDRPSVEGTTVGVLYQDAIVERLREVVGYQPNRLNQRWLETPQGFLWSGAVQPVADRPNAPVEELPQTSLGPGMWVEVTVPFVDLQLANPPARAPWLRARLEEGAAPRFYYSQIVWVDDIRLEADGRATYRFNERYGYGDLFWAPAEAFRPLTTSDVDPIRPEAADKRIKVDVAHQTLQCFEGAQEVYFCRVSTGALYNYRGERVETWGTPPGTHSIWRKALSLPLSGGSADVGWDLPAVGWVSLFVGTGVAIHSTYWHDNYGEPSSRGCVNASPKDAQWIFRWTSPVVPYDPGDLTVGMPGGTRVEVVEV